MKERPVIFSTLMVQANHAGRKRMTRRVVDMDRLKIITRRDIQPDFPLNLMPQYKDNVARSGKKLKGVMNKYGAVSCETPGGLLGLQPGEFDFVCPYAVGSTRLDKVNGKSTWTIYPQNSCLWVRETWYNITGDEPECRHNLAYRANYPACVLEEGWDTFPEMNEIKWRPSIHMPRWACRDVYTVTKVWIERLQDITEEDALAEGVEQHPSENGMYKSYRSQTGVCNSARGSFTTLWDSLNEKRPGCTWNDNPWVWVIEYDNPLWRQA